MTRHYRSYKSRRTIAYMRCVTSIVPIVASPDRLRTVLNRTVVGSNLLSVELSLTKHKPAWGGVIMVEIV
jgi:hypothetical protein